jgi:hypothetical protein
VQVEVLTEGGRAHCCTTARGPSDLARAAQVPGSQPLRDVLLGLVGASDEPIAGGRHKVFGNYALAVIPQTSTIASHLPRAVGIAFSIGRAAKLGVRCPWPADAIAVASFGDASASHSTAVGAINRVLRDIPRLVVAVPARAEDAAPMLRTCLAAAQADGTVCVFLEPIALYHTRDLYEPGDGGWLAPYANPQRWADLHVPIGQGRCYGSGNDLTIVTFGNGRTLVLRDSELTGATPGCGIPRSGA